MNRHEHLSLFVLRVNPLAHRDETDSGKIQTLEDSQRIFCVS
jgi:hypothetical protein